MKEINQAIDLSIAENRKMCEFYRIELMQEKIIYAMFFLKRKTILKFSQQATYLNWNPGEPNGLANENCVHLFASIHTWNDLDSTTNLSYICQKDQGYKFYFILIINPIKLVSAYMNQKINFNGIYEYMQVQCN